MGKPFWHSFPSWILTDLCCRLWILVLFLLPFSGSHVPIPWELTDLCCRSQIIVSSGFPFLGLLIVRSSVRRWPDTRVTESRTKNKIILFQADNHWQVGNADGLFQNCPDGFKTAFDQNPSLKEAIRRAKVKRFSSASWSKVSIWDIFLWLPLPSLLRWGLTKLD